MAIDDENTIRQQVIDHQTQFIVIGTSVYFIEYSMRQTMTNNIYFLNYSVAY